jgi:hypothetical protein
MESVGSRAEELRVWREFIAWQQVGTGGHSAPRGCTPDGKVKLVLPNRPLSRRLRRIFCRLAAAEKNAAKPALAEIFSSRRSRRKKFRLATIVNDSTGMVIGQFPLKGKNKLITHCSVTQISPHYI